MKVIRVIMAIISSVAIRVIFASRAFIAIRKIKVIREHNNINNGSTDCPCFFVRVASLNFSAELIIFLGLSRFFEDVAGSLDEFREFSAIFEDFRRLLRGKW